MLYDYSKIKVFMEITTHCNAGCPQCHRTDPNGLGKIGWLPLVSWTLEDFQKAFPREQLANIRAFKFCGTWGDPIMCKDIFEIVQYVIENSSAYVSFDTNGSIRDEDWWWDFGVMGGKRLEVVFDVDGIDQQMHETYRKFTSLEKVLTNMRMFSNTNAIAKSQTVLFKHNTPYKDQIKQLCYDNGSKTHDFVISDRFMKGPSEAYKVSKTKEVMQLERASSDDLPKGIISGTKVRELKSEITCRWAMPRNEVVITPDGDVVPCCFHVNTYYKYLKTKSKNDLATHPLYQKYVANREKQNVFETPLSEIIRGEWFSKDLEESMKGDNPVPTCVRNCSSRLKTEHQIRETHATK